MAAEQEIIPKGVCSISKVNWATSDKITLIYESVGMKKMLFQKHLSKIEQPNQSFRNKYASFKKKGLKSPTSQTHCPS